MNLSFDAVDIKYILPLIILFTVSLVPVLVKVFNKNKEPGKIYNFLTPMLGALIAAGASAGVGAEFLSKGISSKLLFSGALVMDGVSVLAGILVSLCLGFTIVLAKESPSINKNQLSEAVFLLMNAAVGMLTVLWANNLLVMFVGIEMMSLCLYILVAMSMELKLSKEAALKYFVLGSFASAILVYGIAFIYGAAGTVYLPELITQINATLLSNGYFLLGLSFVLFGLAFKVSLFPFYSWTPDVYQGSSTPLVAFMATGVKLVAFVALLRLIATQVLQFQEAAVFLQVLQWMAVVTILVGNIAALRQDNLKRMLAYSSVAHSGYVLIGLLAVSSSDGQVLGASSVLFYLFSYVIMTFGAFSFLSFLEKSHESALMISDLRGMASRRPYIALSFSVLLLSLAGIPPTVGFFGKFYLFSAAISEGFYWVVAWGVIGSVISVYFYLRPLVVMFMSDEQGVDVEPSRLGTQNIIFITAILVLVIGFVSNPFYLHIQSAIKTIF